VDPVPRDGTRPARFASARGLTDADRPPQRQALSPQRARGVENEGAWQCQAPSVIRMEAAFYRTRWLPFQSVLTAVRSVPLTDELVSVNVRTECAMASDI
jgi:hypothetical protein